MAFAIPILMVMILAGLTILLNRRVLKPLATLQQAMEAASSGDLTVHSATGADDEFGKVSQTFDALAIDLVSGLKQEIAERNKAEGSLRESESRFRSYYELGLIGMAITSLEKGWIQFNDCLCMMFGYSREEFSGKSWAEMTHPDDLALDEAQFQSVLRGEIEGYSMDKRFIRKDGRTLYTALSTMCVRNQDGGVKQFVALIDDISSRKQMEDQLKGYSERLESLVQLRTGELEEAVRELEQRRDQAEAANRAKSMFLATMSHELRTPLNVVLGLSETLQEGLLGDLSPKQRHAVTTIRESGRHLLGVLTDILDLSKIEADRMDLAISQVDLAALCQSALRFFQEAGLAKRLTLSTDITQAPEQLWSDQRRLKQILINLLGNAVKFTPEGGEIGLEVAGDAVARTIRFTIWDTGIGIAPEDQELLFQPFVQVDSNLARRFEGTGLGLALVARLTGLLGGAVSVTSVAGAGSRFTVTLPLRENEADLDSLPVSTMSVASPLLSAGDSGRGFQAHDALDYCTTKERT